MRYIYMASVATGLIAAALAAPAQAGETILYEDEGAWVDVADLPPATEGQGLPLRLIEMQTRLEDGVVRYYGDIALALDSTEALNQLGTITLGWQPDKGDLTVHRVELIRDGRTIDLLAGGARFEVLRREERLEQRILDGALTATMSVSGAEIGDVLRYSFTTTKDEQILDDDMEFAGVLQAEPTPIVAGRMILSWPSDEQVAWRASKVTEGIEEEDRGAYRFVTIDLPVAKAVEIPDDAPPRYRLPPVVRATTFDSYVEVSRAVAPYFSTEGAIEQGGPLANKVAEIAGRTADPLERAALATQFVQDEIGYLLNGLDGGNYIPQSPAETWAARTGDCKAKSLLLLAMLRELGISAEAVLVHSKVGDALPERLPALGNFDHMIVRADIDGTSYWLDGTSSGLRISNIVEVPRFRHALPLRPGGADLQEMAMRAQAIPDETIAIRIDQSAGIDLPAIYQIDFELTGVSAKKYEALALIDDMEQKEESIDKLVKNVLGDHLPVERSVAFDREAGVATVTARGLLTSPWDSDEARMELDVPFQAISGFSFDVDRARPEIAEIPVAVNGPIFYRRKLEWLLPEGEFRLLGRKDLNQVVGGTRLASDAQLEPTRLAIAEEVQSVAWEVPASELPMTRREALRVERGLPRLRAPVDAKRSWQYRGADRAKLDAIEELYARSIEMADADDTEVHLNRARFRYFTGDFKGAVADMDVAIERDPVADSYMTRGAAKWHLGDVEAALADYEIAGDIEPDNLITHSRLEAMAMAGQAEEAVALIDEHAYLFEDPVSEAIARAYALGFAGRASEGREVLREELSIQPDDPALLNWVCWISGLWDMVDDDVLETCTRAVEEANDSSSAIDSRALALFRVGRAEEALRDLDVVLARDPEQQYSRYLRGVIRRAVGREEEGREDLEAALFAQPGLVHTYSTWGLPPR